jgi:hypothetical protein
VAVPWRRFDHATTSDYRVGLRRAEIDVQALVARQPDHAHGRLKTTHQLPRCLSQRLGHLRPSPLAVWIEPPKAATNFGADAETDRPRLNRIFIRLLIHTTGWVPELKIPDSEVSAVPKIRKNQPELYFP